MQYHSLGIFNSKNILLVLAIVTHKTWLNSITVIIIIIKSLCSQQIVYQIWKGNYHYSPSLPTRELHGFNCMINCNSGHQCGKGSMETQVIFVWQQMLRR